MVGKSRMSRNGARICAWAGRGSVLAAGAGAAMILFGGGPANEASPDLEQPVTASNTEPEQTKPSGPSVFVDFEMIGIQLATWNGAAPVTTTEPGTFETKIDRPKNELAYLGLISMGLQQRALMSIEGKQRFMKEGQPVGRVTLVSIAADHVMIREGRTSRRVDRQPEPTERLGYLGSSGAPVQLSNPAARSEEAAFTDRSTARRREISDRIRSESDADGDIPTTTVPAGKARSLPNNSGDDQEGS